MAFTKETTFKALLPSEELHVLFMLLHTSISIMCDSVCLIIGVICWMVSANHVTLLIVDVRYILQTAQSSANAGVVYFRVVLL